MSEVVLFTRPARALDLLQRNALAYRLADEGAARIGGDDTKAGLRLLARACIVSLSHLRGKEEADTFLKGLLSEIEGMR